MEGGSHDSRDWVDRGRELSDETIAEVLRARGHGVLSAAVDGDVVARPMSFGVDGDDLYFQLAAPPESNASRFAESDGPVELVVSAVESVDDWHSVVVRGRLVPVGADEETRAFRALADNAVLPQNALGVGECREFRLARLAVESATGREGPASSLGSGGSASPTASD
ncbi:pyridoxamine 5'-phosphate oxidase family protein [Haloferax marisrubri]|uniref:Pyridoxamine 5'-phosphate oxidase family protein n=1 Tax=Haloferax marisrubri TaxID=1544719 RepID=A0A2P4NR55_9EURY|nr:pyridoxamine 5'-phosphate oxidase family protein [Haloferax marisrubri]POG55621.1 pyridoxamine 5'-phosphate oxidase family protein [Haloferax marisrubri]